MTCFLISYTNKRLEVFKNTDESLHLVDFRRDLRFLKVKMVHGIYIYEYLVITQSLYTLIVAQKTFF